MSLGMRGSLPRVFVAMAVAILVAGCELLPASFLLRTAPAPAQACMDALIVGQLVRHPASGLAIAEPGGGQVTPVEWPFGYSARDEGGRVALLDERGQVVAHEGDEVHVGGGFGTQFWHACGPVSVAVPGS